jgi:hypothetical protein
MNGQLQAAATSPMVPTEQKAGWGHKAQWKRKNSSPDGEGLTDLLFWLSNALFIWYCILISGINI